MSGTRSALIVASSDYTDPDLRRLRAPESDARAHESVLQDPGIGDFEVRTLLNKPAQDVRVAVEAGAIPGLDLRALVEQHNAAGRAMLRKAGLA